MADLDRNLRLTGKRLVKQKAYWQYKMADEIVPSLIIPGPVVKVSGRPESRQEQVEIPVSAQIAERLLKMGRGSEIAVYAVLVAALKALIYHYSGSEDSIVLAPVYQPGVSPDTFNRVVVVRDRIVPAMPFKELLVNVGRTLQEAYENQDFPLADVPELKSFYLGRDKGWIISDTACVLENIHDNAALAGLSAQAVFVFCLAGSHVQGKIAFDAALYERFYIERLAGHFVILLDQALADVQTPVCGLPVLSGLERAEMLESFCAGEKEAVPGATIVDLFLDQVEKTPDRIALSGETVGANGHSPLHCSVSYKELDRRATDVAGELRAQGIGPGSVVALLTGRTVEMIVGLLGILKAGAAYLPIDPSYPQERIDYMLADSGVEIVIGSQAVGANCCSPIQDIGAECKGERQFAPTDLAYVIYTSGSTGRPKGVMIQHQAVVNFISGIRRIIPFSENNVLLSLTTVSFDIFGLEIYLPLTGGARVVLGSEAEQLDGFLAMRRLEEEQVTIFQVTPSRLSALLANPEGGRVLKRLTYLLVGGEAFDRALLDEVRPVLGGRIFNMYGPTETTIWSTVKELTGNGRLTIGRPLVNTGIYILNRGNNLQPIGVPGELCIGGNGLARGYLNNPELTAEKFVGGLYKTGDLARWLPDGDIEFLGRLDAQVKIRGFRIELHEIEIKLRKHPAIEEAVVISREVGAAEKYLCAYLRLKQVKPGQGVGAAELREFLSRSLPDYMIPAYFVFLAQFPLTPNGKLDKRALPDPREFTASCALDRPRNETEEQLARVWAEVLDLHPDRIGIDQNFFELGGHSLNAGNMIYLIQKKFAVDIPLVKIFSHPTIRGLAQLLGTQTESRFMEIMPVEKRDYYEMSYAQRRMWILNQLGQADRAYNISLALEVAGRIDIGDMRRVLQALVDRHESLRTCFTQLEGRPVQRVLDRVELELEVFEIEGQKGHKGQKGQERIEIIVQGFIRPFDLAVAPLIRVGLIKSGEAEHILMVDMHHIISDGVSMGVMVRDFVALYAGNELSPPGLQYKDFSNWQTGDRQREIFENQEAHWLTQFQGEIPLLLLPTDLPRPAIQGFIGNHLAFELGEEETKGLKALAYKWQATLFMVLLACFQVFLSKLSGQEDIVVGTPVAGRQHADLQDVIGMFVNTLALRGFPVGEKRFSQFLEEVKNNALAAFQNQGYPFEELVERVVKNRDMSRNPLFDVMFALQNMDIEEIVIPGLRLKPYMRQSRVAKFDLTLRAWERGDRLHCVLEYCTALFSGASIDRFIGYFREVVARVIGDEHVDLRDIDILSEKERERLVNEFSRGEDRVYPCDKRIDELFFEQVVKSPDRIAIVGANGHSPLHGSVSYKELDRNASVLAGDLMAQGVIPNTIVALQLGRSIGMIIGILGILKAGGAYLPIDPEAPVERVQYMLADSGVEIVIGPQAVGANCCSPIQDIGAECKGERQFAPTDLAYIIYTSGSTGRPKGVLIQHRSVVNLIASQQEEFQVTSQERIMQFSPFYFDASVEQIFLALLSGAALVLVDQETLLDAGAFVTYITAQCITHLHAVPSFLASLELGPIRSLKRILSGGDVCPVSLVENLIRSADFYNRYGPTEITVTCLEMKINAAGCAGGKVPIGRPLGNTQVYIVDKWQKLQPIGVLGELLIAGAGLARGYLNNPELTAERFVFSPLTTHPSPLTNRLYRTGDLCRWLDDGNIEFLGRIDFQVKIRGFRIELHEIEAQLSRHPEIKEAVVLARDGDDSEKYLCAYLVAKAGQTLETKTLRDFLSRTLPEYMIPAYFVFLGQMPLNANGKVDRQALPQPEITIGQGYAAPGDEMEQKLAGLWADVLDIDVSRIGIDDNFFQLGGHSLKTTILIARIHKELNVRVSLAEFFLHPDIRSLSSSIRTALIVEAQDIEAGEEKEYYPLSSAQKRMYVLQQMEPSSTHYHIPALFRLEGKLSSEKFEKSFNALIDRHESLRTSFILVDNQPVQRVLDQVGFELEVFRTDGRGGQGGQSGQSGQELIELIIRGFIRPFDLSRAPLMRVGLVRIETDQSLLLFDIHHIVSDGTSLGIMIKDFMALYKGEILAPLKIRYRDYAGWYWREEEEGEMSKQAEYWLGEFAGDIPVLPLPYDYPRPTVQDFSGHRVFFEVGPEILRALQSLAESQGATLYMVLLNVFSLLLSRLSGQEDIVIGTAVAGRRHADLEGIIGMFVNTLAIRIKPVGSKSFNFYLEEVKQTCLSGLDNQEYPFEELVNRVGVRRDTSRNPLFDVMFVLQNLETRVFDIPGLRLSPYAYENPTAKFDLTLTAVEEEDGLVFSLEYATGLFKEKTVKRFTGYYQNLISEILSNPDQILSELEILGNVEQEQLLNEFNQGIKHRYPDCRTLVDFFSQQIEKTPDRIAVVGANGHSPLHGSVSYKELDRKAAVLAGELIEKGVLPNTIVALQLGRSIEMIIAILGVLKAGGAYLPIDPEAPEERVQYMLADSGAEIVIGPQTVGANCCSPIQDIGSECKGERQFAPTDLAYIIYTSGSTGRPKGVMIQHRSVVNLITFQQKEFQVTPQERILQFSPFYFDASVEQIFLALLSGAALVLVDQETLLEAGAFVSYITTQCITHLHAVPSFLAAMKVGHIDSMRRVISGGDVCPVSLYERFSRYGDFYNEYGPTETTVTSVEMKIGPGMTRTGRVLIGRPLGNTLVYIVDKWQKLQPVGVAGELLIGGAGLARGYLNNPELTEERFVFSPLTTHPSPLTNRLYRTGDLCRWLDDGNIEFLNRIDFQVKIRGFRIELGEIETQLLKHPEIKEAVILALGEGNEKHLCAYLVAKAGQTLETQTLRDFLSRTLPNYMMPPHFIFLEQMPLNINGKIDRKALSVMGWDLQTFPYIAPENEFEWRLAEIWAELLHVDKDKISTNRVFFEIGGDSLKAIQMIAQVHQRFGVQFSLLEVFRASPTIKDISSSLQVICLKGGTQRGKEKAIQQEIII